MMKGAKVSIVWWDECVSCHLDDETRGERPWTLAMVAAMAVLSGERWHVVSQRPSRVCGSVAAGH